MNFIFCKRILTRALKHDFYLQLTKRCVINSLNKGGGGGGGRRRGAFAVKRIAGKENGREENGTDQGNRKIHNFFCPQCSSSSLFCLQASPNRMLSPRPFLFYPGSFLRRRVDNT